MMDRTYFAIKQYDSQNTFHSSTPVGERCTEVLLHSDKLASISRLYDSAVSIWTDATCNCEFGLSAQDWDFQCCIKESEINMNLCTSAVRRLC